MTAWPTGCGISEISRSDGPDYHAERPFYTDSTVYANFDLMVGKNIQKKDPAKYKFMITKFKNPVPKPNSGGRL